MTIYENNFIDGDSGSDCRSPRHNPDKCPRCQQEIEDAIRAEEEAKKEAEEIARYEAEEKLAEQQAEKDFRKEEVRKKRKRIRKPPVLEYKFHREEPNSESDESLKIKNQ